MSWKKGECGNRGGRPKAIVDVQELVRSRTKQNITNLCFWADQTEEPNVAVKANIALHEIAWGKPGQRVEMTGSQGGPIILAWEK